MISYYFYTIRYLKLKQIYHRIWFHLSSPKINTSSIPNLRISKNQFLQPIKKNQSLLDKDTFYFLNKSESLSKIRWDGDKLLTSKLWLYNLHYFDDLNAHRSYERKAWHYELLENWIKENKIGSGIGWDPYPTSLRIVNWIKWYFLGNTFSKNCIHSLVCQARWLSKRIEWHILGNHLFANAKALVFAGLFFSSKESEKWLNKGIKIICDEINEQVLDDGGNFERSPMYHAIFLEDLLDLINISQVYENKIQQSHVNNWKKIANSMLKWMDAMIHPDGEISFFNDSALGIAPNFNELNNYAKRLGIFYSPQKFNRVTNLSHSGYIRVSLKNSTALLDVASIGPDYQPGHAHADTLSFELSLFDHRLIVNGGTSEYGTTKTRQYERSTKSHNTVVVNNLNSSEVWNSFRVARRAYPFSLEIEDLDNEVNITCAHNGYKRLGGKAIHRRNWQFFKSSLIINDYIEGSFDTAYAYFHFHNLISIIKLNNSDFSVQMPNDQKVNIEVKTGDPVIESSYYSPEFGKRFNTKCLKLSLNSFGRSCIKLSWNN